MKGKCLIFILNAKKEERHDKINKWIESLSSSLIYGHFTAIADLISNVYSSLLCRKNGDRHSRHN